MSRRRVAILGKGSLAIRIADWFRHSDQWELVCVVPVIPEPAWTPSLTEWARSSGVPIVESGHYRDLPGAREPGVLDLAFSVFYDKIIRGWFIGNCDRIVNLHNGPLPRYRGVSPINWALKNGETEHGVTIHEITTGIDDGPVIAQLRYSIYPEFDEVKDVYLRALEYGWILFEQTIPILDRIKPRPQASENATYYSGEMNRMLGERSNFTKKESSSRG